MNKMEKTKYEQVMYDLREKGYEISETLDEEGRTSLRWDSRTSSYRIKFDDEGDVVCAEIDVGVGPSFWKFRHDDSWCVSPRGFYPSDRFRLLESLLGIDLFK
jgi:hypothetical protein